MDEMSLNGLEEARDSAWQALYEAGMAAEAAEQKTADAQAAFYEAQDKYAFENGSEENLRRLEEAEKALEEAKKEQSDAQEAFENAASAANEAETAVNDKKEELRKNRDNDVTYVVHTARIECTKGMRESYLALERTHGVKTRQIPQMTVKDTHLNTNIINFGGCHSAENPSVKAAAEAAAESARQTIEENKDWRDWVVGLFVKDKEIEVTESLMEQCAGECLANFPAGAEWVKGHEKVTINGEAVLLRRCSIMCNYGGCITILVSGQPE